MPLLVLPNKTLRVTATWVAEREGSKINLWSSSMEHRKGPQGVVHTHCFENEEDARGAFHLLTEAAIYADALNASTISLQDFCFWDEPPMLEGVPLKEEPRPEGISLASLVARGRGRKNED